MKILDKAVELEKALLRRIGRRSDVKRHPIEIYRAILDEIEDASEAGARGTRIFPYNHIAVTIATSGERQRATAEAVFAEAPTIEQRIRARLQQRGCSLSDPLGVSVKFVDGSTEEWAEREYRVELRRRPITRQAPEKAPSASSKGGQELHLTILAGSAAKPRYALTADRINLGRLGEVLDKHQRVLRQNQVAFQDHDDEVNQSVSRAHAHITFKTADGDARLFDDGSTHGTRVVRNGRTIDVPRGTSRGIKLNDGDELGLGQARLRVELRSVRTAAKDSRSKRGNSSA